MGTAFTRCQRAMLNNSHAHDMFCKNTDPIILQNIMPGYYNYVSR